MGHYKPRCAQSSLLGPLLFNSCVNYLFYAEIDSMIWDYADNNHRVNESNYGKVKRNDHTSSIDTRFIIIHALPDEESSHVIEFRNRKGVYVI